MMTSGLRARIVSVDAIVDSRVHVAEDVVAAGQLEQVVQEPHAAAHVDGAQ